MYLVFWHTTGIKYLPLWILWHFGIYFLLCIILIFFFNHTVTGTSVIMLSWQQMHLEYCQSLEKLKYLLCQMVLPLRTSNHYRVFIESTVRYSLQTTSFWKSMSFPEGQCRRIVPNILQLWYWHVTSPWYFTYLIEKGSKKSFLENPLYRGRTIM